jgi:hypothetical protein
VRYLGNAVQNLQLVLRLPCMQATPIVLHASDVTRQPKEANMLHQISTTGSQLETTPYHAPIPPQLVEQRLAAIFRDSKVSRDAAILPPPDFYIFEPCK